MKYTTKYGEKQLSDVLESKRDRYHLRGDGLSSAIADVFDDDFISGTGVTKRDIKDEIVSVNECSRHISYISANQVDKMTGEINRVSGAVLESNACNNAILCPLCAASKRNAVIQSISPKIKAMEKMKDLYFYLLTLTVPTCDIDNVRSNYNLLRDAWTSFVKMGQRRGKRRSLGEMKKVVGYILSIETVKSNGLYHVHGHCFIVATEPIDYSTYDADKKAVLRAKYGNSIPKDELLPISKHLIKFITIDGSIVDVPLSNLSKQWYEATRGKAVDIHCTPIDRKYIDLTSGEIKDRPLITSCYEVIKYATKAWELPKEELVRLWVALGGTRRITRGGIFSGSAWYKNLWTVLVEKNKCVEFCAELSMQYASSTLEAERAKYLAYLERIDLLRCVGKKYSEQDSTYLVAKYSDMQRKKIFDVIKGVVLGAYLKHKNFIVGNLPMVGKRLSVLYKNNLTDLMRNLMKGISACLYYEIKNENIRGRDTLIIKRFANRLREELFFGSVLRASQSFRTVSDEIHTILANYK